MSPKLVHTTDRTKYKSCRLAWDFSSPLRRNLEPVRRVPAFLFGSAWHAALETYYHPQGATRNIEAAQSTFREYLDTFYNGLETMYAEDEEQHAEFYDLGMGMLDHYGEWAPPQDRFEVIAVEKQYIVHLFDDVYYTLQIDGLVRDYNGLYWIMEDKTADKIPENTDYLLMDEQCGSYAWGVMQVEGIEVAGIIYNIARKKLPTPMKVLKNGLLSTDKRIVTTYDYAARQIMKHHNVDAIPGDYAPFLENLMGKQNPFFYREKVKRNRRELDFLGKKIVEEAKEMISDDISIYRNPNRFNCSTCPFTSPCLSYYEGGDFESMLKGNYHKRKDDILPDELPVGVLNG